MSFLERMPYALLIALAVIMAIVPPGQSHLLEKTRMLFSGTLKRPLDWFDLVLHSAPLILLVIKAAGDLMRRGSGTPS
jgi:hypothetical protein